MITFVTALDNVPTAYVGVTTEEVQRAFDGHLFIDSRFLDTALSNWFLRCKRTVVIPDRIMFVVREDHDELLEHATQTLHDNGEFGIEAEDIERIRNRGMN